MSISVNQKDKALFEHLNIIIQAYEDAALASNNRNAILAVSNGPLEAMGKVLDSASLALKSNKTKSIYDITPQDDNGIIPLPPTVTVKEEQQSIHTEIIGGENAIIDLSAVEFDSDLQKLTGTDNLQDFMSECLDCDLRVNFDWQLKPIDLLGPITDLIKSINVALDNFMTQMNPFASLAELCDFLNNINWLCIPDLIAILMSLKLLLKKYLTFQLKINLDWTVILGPLLKIILDAIAALIQAIAGVLLGPIDCTIGVFKSIAELQKEAATTIDIAAEVAKRIDTRIQQGTGQASVKSDLFSDTEINKMLKELNIEGFTLDVNVKKDSLLDENGIEISPFSFPSGLEISENVRLPDAVKDVRFGAAHWTTKIILAIQEAKNYILELAQKILGSVESLKGLVSGGLNVQLGNLGLILFIKDMISLIMLVISLIKSNKNIKDWCEHLENHPEALEEALGISHEKGLTANVQDKNIVLYKGPEIVGQINTCRNETGIQNTMINQWIQEMKRGQ